MGKDSLLVFKRDSNHSPLERGQGPVAVRRFAKHTPLPPSRGELLGCVRECFLSHTVMLCFALPLLFLALAACAQDQDKKEKKEKKQTKTVTAPVTISTYTPPPNSPLGRKQHPRLYFTAADLPELRQRLQTLYATEFQRYINELDKHFDIPAEQRGRGYPFFDAKNYAFLYMIDPATMRGFSFGHRREEYGRKAIEIAMFIKRETRGDRHSSANLQGENGGYHNLALAVAYDWTFALLSAEEKRSLADAMIRMYDNRDPETNPGEYEKLSNQVTGYIHSGSAGALAMWGDDLGPTYSAKAQEMLNYFNAVFLQRSLETGDKLFEGPGWSEGASYYMLGITNVSFMAGAASSALGENLFYKHDFLRHNALYIFYNTLPLKLRDRYWLSRHDTNSLDDVNNHSFSRILQITAGALRKNDPVMAGVAQWMLTQGGLGLPVEEYKYYDPRIDDLFFNFLWGSKDVRALAPEAADLPLTYKLGLGEIVMKSSFDKETSTHLIFWAPRIWYSPHAHLDQSSFTIYKHGSLALDAGNSKNADDLPRGSSSREAIFHNILGLYNPDEPEEADEPNFMDFSFRPDKNAEHWKDEAFQSGGRSVIGELKAFESGEDYDFIDYDYTASYTGDDKESKARSAVRRFVYLRGPENREFVVIHDLVDSDFEKRWLLHTAFEPQINNDQILVTNNFENVAHGRLLVKSLLPAQKEIVKLGGEGMWFVDANGKLIRSRGPYLDWGAYWTGSWRAEIRAQSGEYLTVMQIGDSRVLQSMSPVVKIESATCSGALIDNKRVVIFSKKNAAQSMVSYQINSTQNVAHLVSGLAPNTFMKIRKNGAPHLNVKTSSHGVLSFTDAPGGNVKYEIGVN